MASFGYADPDTGTSQQMLDHLNAEIVRVLHSGQGYGVNPLTMQRASLSEMRSLRSELMTEVSIAAGTYYPANNLVRLVRRP